MMLFSILALPLELYRAKSMRRNVLYILLLCLVCSCQKEEKEYIPVEPIDWTDCGELVCEEITTDNYWPSYPTGMFIVNGNLIIKDEKGYQLLFHVLTEDGRLVQEFLGRGGGPEEYVASDFNAQLSDGHELEMFDTARGRLISYALDNGRFVFSRAFLPQTSDGTIREIVNAGHYYLAMGENGHFDDNRFLVLDTLGNTVNFMGSYPAIHPDLLVNAEKDLQTILYHTSFFRLSPNKQRAVFASYKGALIQFFDLSSLPDSITTRSVQLERPKKKEQIAQDHEGWVYGFEDVYTTCNHVYAIYNGETAIDNPELGQFILKYDWNGNLLATYKANMGLRSLAVDEASGRVFLIGYINSEMKLFAGYLVDEVQ